MQPDGVSFRLPWSPGRSMGRFFVYVYIGANAHTPGIIAALLFNVVSHVKNPPNSYRPTSRLAKKSHFGRYKILRETLALARLFRL